MHTCMHVKAIILLTNYQEMIAYVPTFGLTTIYSYIEHCTVSTYILSDAKWENVHISYNVNTAAFVIIVI